MITNTRTTQTYTSLAQAMGPAEPGDTLTVQGICHGTALIDLDITISAAPAPSGSPATVTTPTLDGDGAGVVLRMDYGTTVTLSGLRITDGRGSYGGGITAFGTALTLIDVEVTGNAALLYGGGIDNADGTLTLSGSTSIHDNTSREGGGINNVTGTVILNGSATVHHNSATDSPLGGGISSSMGSITLNGSASIHTNTAAGQGIGGGIYGGSADITLNDSASIVSNSARQGGGIYTGGTVTINDDAIVQQNTASLEGGGIYRQFGSITGGYCGISVIDNTPDDCFPAVSTACVITNAADPGSPYATLAAAVSAATAGDSLVVAGICHGITTIDKDLTIAGAAQTPGDGTPTPTLDGDDGGSVVTVTAGQTVTISGLRIVDGSGTETGGTNDGGGVHTSGTLTLTDVEVTGSSVTGLGGGVFNAAGATLTVNGTSSVHGNSADGGGGIFSAGTLSLGGAASVHHNSAWAGGGIGVDLGSLELSGSASIHDNAATHRGGGVFVDGGTITILDSATVHDNAATQDGGGVYSDGGTIAGPYCGVSIYDNSPQDCAPLVSIACVVTNATDAGSPYATLADAVTGATAGDTLVVAGICHGITTIAKDLTIQGAIPTAGRGTPTPTLDGDDLGSVVTVSSGTTVAISGLRIVDGSGTDTGILTYGGGVFNAGVLTLTDVEVTAGSVTGQGGGIANLADAQLTLSGTSSVHHNAAVAGGGGIDASGTVVLQGGTSVDHNSAPYGAGIYGQGALALHDDAAIHDNTADLDGGGVYLADGTITIDGDAIVQQNTAGDHGGGVYNDAGTFAGGYCGISIVDNSPEDCAPGDAGACVVTNTATGTEYATLQAAVTAAGGGDTLTLSGVCSGATSIDRNLTVTGVAPTPGSGRPTPTLRGIGSGTVVTVAQGTVSLTGLRITDGYAFVGAGIRNFGILTLTDVEVTGNTTASGGYGAGIYNFGTLTLAGSTAIHHNTADHDGGGISSPQGTITLTGSASIHHNAAQSGAGVYLFSGSIVLEGTASIHHNTATTGGDGGGIFSRDGTVTLRDAASISDNTAWEGGGIGMTGTGLLTIEDDASIHDNSANVSGGGVGIVDGTVTFAGPYCGISIHGNIPDDCGPDVSTACVVTDTGTSQTYGSLAAAAAATASGASLTVAGICHGVTTIDKDLTITAVTPTAGSGAPTPTLDGDGAGTVVWVDLGTTVSMTGLRIVGGSSPGGAGLYVGGTATLTDVEVTGNHTSSNGGGAVVTGTLVLSGTSSIHHNSAGSSGGGIFGGVGGSITLNGSASIRDNVASAGTGGGLFASGPVTLNGTASVHDNTSSGSGGGVYVQNATLTLNDSASIHDNATTSAFADGGGVFAYYGGITLNDTAAIHHNSASATGGGLYVAESTLTINDDAAVHHNSATTYGGMRRSGGTVAGGYCGISIVDNTPDDCGPDVLTACVVTNFQQSQAYADLASAVMTASPGDALTVEGICHGTTVIDRNLTIVGIPPAIGGGTPFPTLDGDDAGRVVTVGSGVWVSMLSLTITDGSASQGGGVAAFAGSTIFLTDVQVTGNTATSTGGGIQNWGTLVLDGTTSIRGNTLATGAIGGAGILNAGTLTLLDTASVTHNTIADLGVGAGVFNAGTLALDDSAAIAHNTTAGSGGGVYLDSGTLTILGAASIDHNSAGVDGGGVLNNAGTFTDGYCGISITDNTPNDCGTAVPSACSVVNVSTTDAYTTLAAAVSAATAGDTLTVSGICHGITTIGKALTISATAPTPGSGAPVTTLDGDGLGSVVTVTAGQTVSISGLRIAGGSGTTSGGYTYGGGIHNSGTLTLTDVEVTGSSATASGGGIFNAATGTLTLDGASSVHGNTALSGGAIDDRGSLTLGGTTSIHDNGARTGGAILAVGTLALHDTAEIRDNTASEDGGAVLAIGATITLDGASSIHDNSAAQAGGGIFLDGGTITILDTATIHDNSATQSGGGVYRQSGTFTGGYCGLSIVGNSPDDCAPDVSTACVVTNATDAGSPYASLWEATAAATAGDTIVVSGICRGTATIEKDLTIEGAAPTAGTGQPTPTLDGDGQESVVTVVNATVTISDLRIVDGHAAYGGGIHVDTGTVVLTDVEITGNTATQRGGGIVGFSATVTLNGATSVHGNTANTGGGIAGDGLTLTMNDQTSVSDNTASEGGGIFSWTQSVDPAIIVLNDSASIDHNTASGPGGVYLWYSASLTLNDSASIHHNSGSWGPGGVLSAGTLTLNGSASIHHNSTNSDGGGVRTDSGTLTINDAASIDHNDAGGDGGGLYQGGGIVTGPYCGVSITENTPNDCRTSVSVACNVTNTQSGLVYDSLAEAVANATAGDTLSVLGICHGITTIDKDLEIAGGTPDPTNGTPTPTLDGDDLGSVVTVSPGVTAGIWSLRIVDGSADAGGGIDNGGTLTLTNVELTGNVAVTTGGAIRSTGTLTIVGTSSIHGNTATDGAGIHAAGPVTLAGTATVTGNDATAFGGGLYLDGGTLTLNDSPSIDHNSATTAGGGVYNVGGTFTAGYCGILITDNLPEDCAPSVISACTATVSGSPTTYSTLAAAVAAAAGGSTITIGGLCHGTTTIGKDLTIAGLVPVAGSGAPPTALDGDALGSVITVSSGVTVSISGLAIENGSATDGGGIHNDGTVTLTDVEVVGNAASGKGGGIYTTGSLTLAGTARVHDNTADTDGGGVYSEGGSLEGGYCGVSIVGNSPNDCAPNVSTACVVTVGPSGLQYDTLAGAIVSASWGATLTVAGLCHGTSFIDRDLTITGITPVPGSGAPAPTLDGDDVSSVVSVGPSVAVSISGLRIVDGTATLGGGINNSGTLTLTDVEVSGNTAVLGGGIDVLAGSVTLVDTEVAFNDATSGGGIYQEAGALTLSGTTSVHHDTATLWGGGIHSTNYSTLTLNDTAAVHDNGAFYGGGIWLEGSSTLTIDDAASVHDNTATDSGGGLYYLNSTLGGGYCGTRIRDNAPDDCYPAVPTDCSVIDTGSQAQYATLAAAIAAVPAGSTLYVDGVCHGTATIDKSLTIYGSLATPGSGTPGSTLDGDGAGTVLTIDAASPITVSLSSLSIVDGAGSSCGAGATCGGGLRIGANATVDLSIVEVLENTATYGAGIHNAGILSIQGGTRIHHNAATGDGGAIFSTASVTMSGTAVIDANTAAGSGGGIYLDGGSLTMGSGPSIDHNIATTAGGGVYNNGGALAGSYCGDSIIDNLPQDCAPAVITACTVTIAGSPTVYGTLAAAVTDAIQGDTISVAGRCHGVTTITKDLTIAGVLPVSGSGAPPGTLDGDGLDSVVVVGSNATVAISDVVITDGAATNGGGVSNDGTLALTDVTVAGNQATTGGGIISTGALTLTDVRVTGNQATTGGGIYAAGPLTIQGASSIDHNTSSESGGGVAASDSVTLLGSSSIDHNTAGDVGGGLLMDGGTLTIGGTAGIHDNTATNSHGGVYRLSGTMAGGYCGVSITSNAPDDCGPSVATACQVTNVDTSAGYDSLQGAVYEANDQETLRVSGICHGVTTIDRDLTIEAIAPPAGDGTPLPTLDGDSGGSVVTIDTGIVVAISGLRIVDGLAVTGGAIYSDGSLTLTDVELTGNTADYGAGIYAYGGAVTLAGATSIHDNEAFDGGGIYIYYGTLTMGNATAIGGNTATNRGGGLFNENGTVAGGYCGTLVTGNSPQDCWPPVTDTCVVANAADASSPYDTLAAAVAAAAIGDTITVSGICHGITTIDRSLTIAGAAPPVGNGTPTPTLDGDDLGSVITVGAGVTASVSGLRIVDGAGTETGGLTYGGGIHNSGALTLTDVEVTGNAVTGQGGGVYNTGTGTLTLDGASSIHHDSAGTDGGGVYSDGGAVTLNGSASIDDNTAGLSGGGILSTGPVTLNGSASLHHNTAGSGGGIYFYFASLTLNDSASIHHNTATMYGGMQQYGGTVAGGYCGISIVDNTPDDCGPDVSTACVVANAADPSSPHTTLAAAVGAASPGDTLTVSGICHGITSIALNLAIEGVVPPAGDGTPPATLDGDSLGATISLGVYQELALYDLVVTGGAGGYGGGIVADYGSNLWLEDVEVTGNTATGDGAGIWSAATVVLAGASSVHDNAAGGSAGGLYVAGPLSVTGTSSVHHNSAVGGSGGGIWAAVNTVVDVSASVYGNVALIGGGVYVTGALTLGGSASIHDNVATGAPGGGIYMDSGTLLMLNSATVSANTAPDVPDGGGLYVAGGTVLGGYCGISIVGNSPTDCNGGVFTSCRVTNTRTTVVSEPLSSVVAAADPGDELMVEGICHGTTTIDKDLTIVGATPPAGLGAPNPRLDGDISGTVITVANATVTMSGLTITGGYATNGGGIVVDGSLGVTSLTLDGVEVTGNIATNGGGGIYVDAGDLHLTGTTRVHGNSAGDQGGGIYDQGGSVEITAPAEVDDNVASYGGGGLHDGALNDVLAVATLGYCGTSVHDNSPNDCDPDPTCIVTNTTNIPATTTTSLGDATLSASPGDTITVQGRCVGTTGIATNLTIVGDQPTGATPPVLDGELGGSVLTITSGATVSITGLTVARGSSSQGAGIYTSGALTLTDVAVTANTADYGAGIYMAGGTVALAGATSVHDNAASQAGGGVYVAAGALSLDGTAVIVANTAPIGAGIHDFVGSIDGTLCGSQIAGNTPDDCAIP